MTVTRFHDQLSGRGAGGLAGEAGAVITWKERGVAGESGALITWKEPCPVEAAPFPPRAGADSQAAGCAVLCQAEVGSWRGGRGAAQIWGGEEQGNGDRHKALLRSTALQTGLPASSCSHMARVKMADEPAPFRQSYSDVSATMLSFMNHMRTSVTLYYFRVQHICSI